MHFPQRHQQQPVFTEANDLGKNRLLSPSRYLTDIAYGQIRTIRLDNKPRNLNDMPNALCKPPSPQPLLKPFRRPK